MALITQPLRDEHKELLPHIEMLRAVADSVGDVSIESLRNNTGQAYSFLTVHLIPHAKAEDKALYPVVQRLMGAPQATVTMSRDHVEVGRLTEELGHLRTGLNKAAVTDSQAKALRRVLYGLYALVSVHFAKEEEIYLPLLDARLTKEEAEEMFERMEDTARDVKARFAARH